MAQYTMKSRKEGADKMTILSLSLSLKPNPKPMLSCTV